MEKLSIYNTYVVMESQEQCDRMKQLCVDNGLKINKGLMNDFVFNNNYKYNYFYNGFISRNFLVCTINFKNYFENLTKVTEKEFIELLKTTK